MSINIRNSFSKYLTAADFKRKPQVVTIESVDAVTIGSDDKIAVYFSELDKGLVLNKTNGDIICDLFGDYEEDWVGGKIELYSTKTQFKGKMVNCIRAREVRETAKRKNSKAAD